MAPSGRRKEHKYSKVLPPSGTVAVIVPPGVGTLTVVTPPLVVVAVTPRLQPVEMVFISNVTAPVLAKALPQLSVAPVTILMLVDARIFP
jgi:hypothetical protein